MKRNLSLILASLFICSSLMTMAQNKASGSVKSAVVTYKTIVNQKESSRGPRLTLIYENNQEKIPPSQRGTRVSRFDVPSETTYIDYTGKNTYQTADFKSGKRLTVETPFSTLPVLEPVSGTAMIAGFKCKKAQTVIRSNKIEVWYTENAGFVGTPMSNLVIPNALILRVVRNGNYETVVDSIKYPTVKSTPPLLPASWGEIMDAVAYKARITENYITTINVFDHEQISFGNEIKNPEGEQLDKTYKFSGGSVILKKVKLPEKGSDYSIFAELTQYSNGDAYDRTGSVFIIPTDRPVNFLQALQKGLGVLPVYKDKQGTPYQGMVATDDYTPLVELVRFFTPFGIRKYNDQKVQGLVWQDSTYFKQEVTPILSNYSGDVWIGIFIGNYDKVGHIAGLKLKYYPNDQVEKKTPAPKQWICPLFNTVNVMEMSGQNYGTMFDQDSLTVNFTVPKGLKDIRLQYITTGHGGWDGGDEFNPKMNRIIIDGKLLFSYTPWRSDCATFRQYNPASGNAWNGLTSSDYSRSGWCPGTLTNPVFVPVTNLEPGKHKMKVAIPLGKREGTSFSAWCISGVLIGEFE